MWRVKQGYQWESQSTPLSVWATLQFNHCIHYDDQTVPLKQGSQALLIFQYMIFLLWGKYCCCWVIQEAKRLPWQPTQQSPICKIITFVHRWNRNDSNWDHWNIPSPKWEPTSPKAAATLTWGASLGPRWRLCPAAWEERCWLNAVWFRAWSINSIAIASGYTDTNAEQANLPPGPHPLGARSAVASCLLSGLRCSPAEMETTRNCG